MSAALLQLLTLASSCSSWLYISAPAKFKFLLILRMRIFLCTSWFHPPTEEEGCFHLNQRKASLVWESGMREGSSSFIPTGPKQKQEQTDWGHLSVWRRNTVLFFISAVLITPCHKARRWGQGTRAWFQIHTNQYQIISSSSIYWLFSHNLF